MVRLLLLILISVVVLLSYNGIVSAWVSTPLACVLAYLLGVPLLVSSTLRVRVDHVIEPVLPSDLTDGQILTLHAYQEQLEALGFVEVGWLCVKDMVPNAQIYFALMNHPTLRVAAMASMTVGLLNVEYIDSPPDASHNQMTNWNIELSSDTIEGIGYNTANIADAPNPGLDRLRHSLRLAGESDLARLFKIHRAWLDDLGLTHQKLRPLPDDIDAWTTELRAMSLRQFRAAADAGFLTLNESDQSYQPTLKGACLMAWAQMWPFKNIRNASYARRCRKEARRLIGARV